MYTTIEPSTSRLMLKNPRCAFQLRCHPIIGQRRLGRLSPARSHKVPMRGHTVGDGSGVAVCDACDEHSASEQQTPLRIATLVPVQPHATSTPRKTSGDRAVYGTGTSFSTALYEGAPGRGENWVASGLKPREVRITAKIGKCTISIHHTSYIQKGRDEKFVHMCAVLYWTNAHRGTAAPRFRILLLYIYIYDEQTRTHGRRPLHTNT